MWEVDVCSSSVQPTIQHNKARTMSIIRGISFESFEYSLEEFFRTLEIVRLSTHTRHVFQKTSRKTLLSLAACMFFVYSHLYLVIVSTALFLSEKFVLVQSVHSSENYIIWNEEGGKRAENEEKKDCKMLGDTHHTSWFMWMSFNSLSRGDSSATILKPAGSRPCLTATACSYEWWYFNSQLSLDERGTR